MMSGRKILVSDPAKKRKSMGTDAPSKRRPKKETSLTKGNDPNASSTYTDSSIWSIEFRQLDQVFRSLNTVYTFCCTRKHFPTTFENLKSSVENLTRR
jgi:DEAD/DEAH box helicase domain-containing protein